MRIYLRMTPNKERVPFNYQTFLTGAIHKWLGENTMHDQLSLYSFSWLKGGKANQNGLYFENGADWFISAWDKEFIKSLVRGIQDDSNVAWGMGITEIVIQENPDLTTKEQFRVASPVLVKRTFDNKVCHYLHNQPETAAMLTETLKNKMLKAGMVDEGVQVQFDASYQNPKTKLIKYKNVANKVNMCPILIKGSPETKAFAWCVGVGNSTGIGFGALL